MILLELMFFLMFFFEFGNIDPIRCFLYAYKSCGSQYKHTL